MSSMENWTAKEIELRLKNEEIDEKRRQYERDEAADRREENKRKFSIVTTSGVSVS